MDVFSKAARSKIMSRVKGRENALTELALLKIFRRYKIIGWRRKQSIFGKPDFVFRASKVAVFVDGCFWHGCPIHAKCPTSNVVFWENKLRKNVLRDKAVNLELKSQGWRVLRIWQHDLIVRNEEKIVMRVLKAIEPVSKRNAKS